jgi:hypothetical protein
VGPASGVEEGPACATASGRDDGPGEVRPALDGAGGCPEGEAGAAKADDRAAVGVGDGSARGDWLGPGVLATPDCVGNAGGLGVGSSENVGLGMALAGSVGVGVGTGVGTGVGRSAGRTVTGSATPGSSAPVQSCRSCAWVGQLLAPATVGRAVIVNVTD